MVLGMQRIEFCITIGTQDKTRTLIHECTAHVGLMLPSVKNNVMTSAWESSHASIEKLAKTKKSAASRTHLTSSVGMSCLGSCHHIMPHLQPTVKLFYWSNKDINFRLPTSRTIPCHGQLSPMKQSDGQSETRTMYQIKKEAKDVTGCVLESTLYNGLAIGDTGLILISMKFTSSDVHCALWRCSQCLKRSILSIGPLHQNHSSLLRLRPTIESLPSERFWWRVPCDLNLALNKKV